MLVHGVDDNVPVMNVFFPTVSPPVATTDANRPHVPSTLVSQLSVVSCAFSGYATLTFSAESDVSSVIIGLPASAVNCRPVVLLSNASMRVSRI